MLTAILDGVESMVTDDQYESSSDHEGGWECAEQLHCDHPDEKHVYEDDGEFVHRLCECGAYLGCRENYS